LAEAMQLNSRVEFIQHGKENNVKAEENQALKLV